MTLSAQIACSRQWLNGTSEQSLPVWLSAESASCAIPQIFAPLLIEDFTMPSSHTLEPRFTPLSGCMSQHVSVEPHTVIVDNHRISVQELPLMISHARFLSAFAVKFSPPYP